MNQKEFNEKLKQARKIQDLAMKTVEESNTFVDSDFKKSNDMLVGGVNLWQQGCEIALNAISAALNSGLLTLTEEEEKKLIEINSQN